MNDFDGPSTAATTTPVITRKRRKQEPAVIKRTGKRAIGLFIDGTGLDRAARRLNRRVDMAALVRGVTSGTAPLVARYYTLIPFEDDSRHRAFLDAVARAGLTVIVKRLPPKGVTRQVSVDLEMAADIVAFAYGRTDFSTTNQYNPEHGLPQAAQGRFGSETQVNGATLTHSGSSVPGGLTLKRGALKSDSYGGSEVSSLEGDPSNGSNATPHLGTSSTGEPLEGTPVMKPAASEEKIIRSITVVCPSRELAYPISLVRELGVDTVTADFGSFNGGDVLKSAAKFTDLSDSETIWR